MAIELSPDPGSEAHDSRNLERFRRDVIELRKRLGHLVVESRDYGVENLDEIEKHMLALISDRELLARVVLGLPRGGDLGPDARPELARIRGRQGWIQAIEQKPRDA